MRVSMSPAAPVPLRAGIGIEMVPRQCKLKPYQPVEIEKLAVSGDFILYASPDSTYARTRQLLDNAKTSILIGIYDFTADYMRDILTNAIHRGVTVSIMLDLDNRKGEPELWEQMIRDGITGIPAPSCASRESRYFSSSHEKVIVIDNEWTLIQSGNYTDNSIPKNEIDGCDPADPESYVPGNRDMGVAIRSGELAGFFTGILTSDIKLQLDGMRGEAPGPGIKSLPLSLEAAKPPKMPPHLCRSKDLTPDNAIDVVPVLSPDNYMKVIPGFLASATRSVFIEQQYIRSTQPEIRKLLGSIRSAREENPDLDVRIVLALPYSAGDPAEIASIQGLGDFGFETGKNVRFLNSKYFVHCHNKLIIVDEKAVLISSQNWSDSAVIKNREAGVLMYSPEIAGYYTSIFKGDWDTGLTALPKKKGQVAPAGLEPEGMIGVDRGDYTEV
jgi:phosphatidylserine/phosphatidylglycerophosphate/cardiolipin synthase-like enzyme